MHAEDSFIPEHVTDAAARWLARRDRGLKKDEETEFARWIAEDPRHAGELARLEEGWRRSDLAKASPELAAMAMDIDQATARRGSRRWNFAGLAAAAALVLAAGLAWSHYVPRAYVTAKPSYEVIASAARRMTLEDGSVLELRGDSEVRVGYTATERRVALMRGEVHFTVASNPSQPFIVTAGGAAVRAVGTAFNVRYEREQVEVLVTEGKIRVAGLEPEISAEASASAPLVVAGERAIVSQPGKASGVAVAVAAPAEIEQALAWQDTRMVFFRTPLAEAVEAFNRHATGGVRLVVGDASLLGRKLGGSFRAGNAEAFVRLLEQSAEIRAERRGAEIVLLPNR